MRCQRVILTLLVGVMIALAVPVSASKAGRRNTAVGATALSLYELARGKTGTGVLAGAGAYYAWSRYNKARKNDNRQKAYLEGYRAGVQRSYREWQPSRRRR